LPCEPGVRAKGTRWYRVELERSHAQPPDGTRRYTCMVYSMRAPHGLRACTQHTQGSRGGPLRAITAPRGHPVGRLCPSRCRPAFQSLVVYSAAFGVSPVHRMCKLLLLLSLLHLAFTEFFLLILIPFLVAIFLFFIFFFFSFPSKH
jgi:hypothetical protein